MKWYELARRVGKTAEELRERCVQSVELNTQPYRTGASDVCLNFLPSDLVALSIEELLDILRSRYGDLVDLAVSPEWTDPGNPVDEAPEALRGPVAGEKNTDWIRHTNMVGVNVRTVGSFFGVVNYALSLSRVHDSIHLLPIWEPGVVGSLYGMSSRHINREFYSDHVASLLPHLDGPERQLKAVINLLHLMGKAVGMDVIPHTDRFSEIVLSRPGDFEWLRREDTHIVDHRSDLHVEVEERIKEFIRRNGAATANGTPADVTIETLFDETTSDSEREYLLFGPPADAPLRSTRRKALARSIYKAGYEPVPATMAPPYRGLKVDTDTAHRDSDGHIWREYKFINPESMSRVFGPLARYKLYERVDDNRNWEIDFTRPRRAVWASVQGFYGSLQRTYGFDFMRGDMSHVQMRPDGTPVQPDSYYDLLGSVATAVRGQNNAPHFAYFAESFIAPPNVMAYGDEIDHLEACGAEVTLGDLQSCSVESPEFFQRLRLYRDIGDTRRVTPSFTVMTADKDDPRFDGYYLRGNEARYLTALFMTDMPSYTALNFECRDPHYQPAVNEAYTKLYVFQETDGPKATNGPFQFGNNGYLFFRITRIRLFAEEWLPDLKGAAVQWLLPPDATGQRPYLAWRVKNIVFVVNFGRTALSSIRVPSGAYETNFGAASCIFSTDETRRTGGDYAVIDGGRSIHIPDITAGEGIVFTLS